MAKLHQEHSNKSSVEADALKNAYDDAIIFSLQEEEYSPDQEALLEHAKSEAASGGKILLDQSNLTPGMRKHAVSPVDKQLSAWKKLRDRFETNLEPFKADLTAVIENDKKRKELQKELEQTEISINEKWNKNTDFVNKREDYLLYKNKHDDIRAREGEREAKVPKWGYISFLVMIMVVEVAINYEAFLEFYGTRFFAFGTAVIIGIAIAFISHIHGEMAKQGKYHFGDAVSGKQIAWNVAKVVLATLVLAAICYFVGYSRYAAAISLLDAVGGAGLPDILGNQTDPTEGIAEKVSVSVLANIVVWFIGAVWAYILHDKNPHYASACISMRKSYKKFHRLQKKLDEEVRLKSAQLRDELEQLETKANVRFENIRPIKDKLDQVVKHQEAILDEAKAHIDGRIAEYKYALTATVSGDGHSTVFNRSGDMLDHQQYQSEETVYALGQLAEKIGQIKIFQEISEYEQEKEAQNNA